MRRRMVFGGLVVAVFVTLAGVAHARNVTLTIPMEDVGVKGTERGDCYVVKFELPSELAGKRLDSVFLDFVVDASPTREEKAEMTPLIGVFPLTEATTGATLEYESDVPSIRPIPMGENQKVRADITDIVKGWLVNPSSNHGVVIGALTGPEVATVELKSNALSSGAAIRVTFFYQNRFGDRVSSK